MAIQTATNPETGERRAYINGEWQPIEQSATNPQGLKAYKIGGAWHVDDTPAAPAPSEIPAARKPVDLGDISRGIVETPGVILTGLAGQLVGTPYGVIKSISEGGYGTQAGVDRAQQYAREAAQALTYTPRTQTARDILNALGNVTEQSKLAGLNPTIANELSVLASPAVRQAGAALRSEAELVKPALVKPFQEAAQRKAERRSSESWQNAAQIDAAKNARELGILLNPATSNPTVGNKLMGALAGTENVDVRFARENEPKWTIIAKREMGLGKDEFLDDAAFNRALDAKSKPYDAVRNISQLKAPETVLAEINNLRIARPTIGGESSAAAVNSLVDEAIAKLKEGRSGAEVLTDIRKLRKDAKNIYNTQQKSGVPDTTLIAKADANMSIANALENLIEANVTDPKLLANLRKARAEMAQIYSYQRATDPVTGKVDPIELAKMLAKREPLSGNAKRMAEIATVYPSVAFVGPETSNVGAKITRSGIGGAAGYVAGAPFGIGPFTSILGAGVGGASSGLTTKYMGRLGYQRSYAVPPDYRIPFSAGEVNNLAPKNMNKLRND